VLGLFHNRACRQHRVARPENSGYRTGAMIPPVHYRSVHLLRSRGSENAAPSGIEQWVVFECHDRLSHRVERTPARREDVAPSLERAPQPLVIEWYAI